MIKDRQTVPLFLLIMAGPQQGDRIPLDRPILLGRDPKSRVNFDDERVSRHHALIDIVDERPVIRDLGSKNGTYVNGREITEPYQLRPTDRVRLGKTLMAIMPSTEQVPGVDRPGEIETRADFGSSAGEDERLDIDRRTLRRATELTARIAALSKTRHSLSSIVSILRREFQADAGGLFTLQPALQPAYIDGDLCLLPQQMIQIDALRDVRRSEALHLTVSPNATPDHATMAIPLRDEEEGTFVFVLRRDLSRPFDLEHKALADTLAECLRVLPLASIVQEGAPTVLADHLGIIGSSEAMTRVREQLRTYAGTDAIVLIRGESGTGKELCARAISQLSNRRFGPFVEVNCACMMPELIEAELFGHEKGAFTGAVGRRLGKLEVADGGTLFLDEIGEIPIDLQAKLLRVLEGRPYYRLGGTELIASDVRFVCATNRNLEQMVKKGGFREDLYHRINVLALALPSLRDHLEDIPELVPHVISQIQGEYIPARDYTVTPRAYRRLLSHSWPGNVRELANVLQRVILLSTSNVIDEPMIPAEIGDDGASTTAAVPRLQVLTEMIEREEISRALMEAKGQKSLAARLLGISRPTLDKKIKSYNLATLVAARGRDDLPEQTD